MMFHVQLPVTEQEKLVNWMVRRLDWLKSCLTPLHMELMRLEKVYEAKPLSRTKTFPYMGAPNVIVGVVPIETDTYTAREKSAYFQTEPLWTKKGLTENSTGIEQFRKAQETFLNYVGTQKGQMDLAQVYDRLFAEKNKLGTGILYNPWTEENESIISLTGEVSMFTRHKGPKPEVIDIYNFLLAPNVTDPDDCDFIGHKVPMNRDDLKKRLREKTYYSDALKQVMVSSDRQGPNQAQREQQDSASVHTAQSEEFAAEWDIVQAFIRWDVFAGTSIADHNKVTGQLESERELPAGSYNLIVTFHQKTRQILRLIVNFYPRNINPYVVWQFMKRKGTSFGKGFAEMLEEIQRIASDNMNNRMANGAIANARIWKAKSQKAALAAKTMYPNAVLMMDNPVTDLIPEQMGDVYPSAFQEETSIWSLAERTTGNPEAQQGSGAGTVGKTKGIYTAMPALAAMQAGNTRGDIHIFDSKCFHTVVGYKTQLMYGHFGVPEDLLSQFGELGPVIKASFEQENLNKLLIPTRAASAAINTEVERQNGQLVFSLLQGFAEKASQTLIACGNPQTPELIGKYLWDCLIAATMQARAICKAFNYDDSNRLVPDLPAADYATFRQSTAPPAPPQLAPAAGGSAVPPGSGAPLPLPHPGVVNARPPQGPVPHFLPPGGNAGPAMGARPQ